jgi:hypothetical protein
MGTWSIVGNLIKLLNGISSQITLYDFFFNYYESSNAS